jgi:hypothetical protein
MQMSFHRDPVRSRAGITTRRRSSRGLSLLFGMNLCIACP